MLTAEQNERATRVGPGTPCGELLRRYWHVLCPTAEITAENPKKRIRILGEDLLLYQAAGGELVCMAERCSHRNVSLFRGFIEDGGIRCCYHGWKYDGTGRCIERPFESSEPPAAANLRTYPVESLGGLVFVYMGPDPSRAPLLPRWDVLVNTDRPRRILVMPEHDCNWLQIQENTVDSIHSYYLHGQMAQIEGEQSGEAFRNVSKFYNRKIVSYDWRPCDWGIEKVLKYEDAPEIEVRPPLIFPNILRIPEGPRETLHFRVPVDDEHTRIFHVSINALGSAPPVPPDQTPYVYEESPPNYDTYTAKLDNFYRQDRYAWESQGVIADRTHEVLGASDRGIVLYRRMLFEQIDRVERGEEPTIAMVRDPKQNDVITFMPGSLPWEWAEFKAQTIWSDAKEPVG